MRALWLDRPNCSHNVSRIVKCIRRISELLQGGPGTEPEPETGTVGTFFPETKSGTGTAGTVKIFRTETQRALRDRLMSRGKNCLPTVSRQFLTRNYPRPNCLPKCLPNCLSPTREGFLSSFKINPAVRVIARQVRGKNCLAAIFAPRHQSVSSGPLGTGTGTVLSLLNCNETHKTLFLEEPPEPKTGTARTVPSPNRNRTEPGATLPFS